MDLSEIINKYSNVAIKLPPAPVAFLKTIDLSEDQETFNESEHLQISCSQPFEATGVFEYAIEKSNIIAQGEDIKTVYDLTLRTKAKIDHSYQPGDTVGILTRNFDHDVNDLLEHLDMTLMAHRKLRVEVDPATKKKAAKLPVYVPPVIQIDKLFKECLDLRAIPKKLFLRVLLDHTTNDQERQFVSLLCSKDCHAYDDIILEPRLSFISLLKYIPSCLPPVSVLIEHLPRLMARPYSIASYQEGQQHTETLRIIFSLNEELPGLTTTMLKNCCTNGSPIFLYFRKSTHFVYTNNAMSSDIVMIGVGTGIAPYLSFLEKRSKALHASTLGNAQLIAGFRYEKSSYICRDELERYVKDKVLNDFMVAFSRDSDSRFRHVQDLIKANKETFARLLCGGDCKFYVCGDGKSMLPQVERKFAQVISAVQNIDEEEAQAMIAELKKSEQYVEDIWL